MRFRRQILRAATAADALQAVQSVRHGPSPSAKFLLDGLARVVALLPRASREWTVEGSPAEQLLQGLRQRAESTLGLAVVGTSEHSLALSPAQAVRALELLSRLAPLKGVLPLPIRACMDSLLLVAARGTSYDDAAAAVKWGWKPDLAMLVVAQRVARLRLGAPGAPAVSPFSWALPADLAEGEDDSLHAALIKAARDALHRLQTRHIPVMEAQALRRFLVDALAGGAGLSPALLGAAFQRAAALLEGATQLAEGPSGSTDGVPALWLTGAVDPLAGIGLAQALLNWYEAAKDAATATGSAEAVALCEQLEPALSQALAALFQLARSSLEPPLLPLPDRAKKEGLPAPPPRTPVALDLPPAAATQLGRLLRAAITGAPASTAVEEPQGASSSGANRLADAAAALLPLLRENFLRRLRDVPLTLAAAATGGASRPPSPPTASQLGLSGDDVAHIATTAATLGLADAELCGVIDAATVALLQAGGAGANPAGAPDASSPRLPAETSGGLLTTADLVAIGRALATAAGFGGSSRYAAVAACLRLVGAFAHAGGQAQGSDATGASAPPLPPLSPRVFGVLPAPAERQRLAAASRQAAASDALLAALLGWKPAPPPDAVSADVSGKQPRGRFARPFPPQLRAAFAEGARGAAAGAEGEADATAAAAAAELGSVRCVSAAFEPDPERAAVATAAYVSRSLQGLLVEASTASAAVALPAPAVLRYLSPPATSPERPHCAGASWFYPAAAAAVPAAQPAQAGGPAKPKFSAVLPGVVFGADAGPAPPAPVLDRLATFSVESAASQARTALARDPALAAAFTVLRKGLLDVTDAWRVVCSRLPAGARHLAVKPLAPSPPGVLVSHAAVPALKLAVYLAQPEECRPAPCGTTGAPLAPWLHASVQAIQACGWSVWVLPVDCSPSGSATPALDDADAHARRQAMQRQAVAALVEAASVCGALPAASTAASASVTAAREQVLLLRQLGLPLPPAARGAARYPPPVKAGRLHAPAAK